MRTPKGLNKIINYILFFFKVIAVLSIAIIGVNLISGKLILPESLTNDQLLGLILVIYALIILWGRK